MEKGYQELNRHNNHHNHNGNGSVNIVAGLLIGSLAGAFTMLLLAPQSGEKTRMQIKEKGIELRDQTTDKVEEAIAQARLESKKIIDGGQQKAKELIYQGENLLIEQLDHVSDAARASKKAIRDSQS